MSDTETETVKSAWDMACPKCGHDDQLHIAAVVVVKLSAEGSTEIGSHEWDNESDCVCWNCDHTAIVKEFMIPKPETEDA